MVSCITSYIPLRPRTKPAVTLKVIVLPNAFIFTISVRIFLSSTYKCNFLGADNKQ